MNSTKANEILASGNVAVFCPVSGEVVKAEDTMRVDYEVKFKDSEGKVLNHTSMKTLRVSPKAFADVLKALKTNGIETVE